MALDQSTSPDWRIPGAGMAGLQPLHDFAQGAQPTAARPRSLNTPSNRTELR